MEALIKDSEAKSLTIGEQHSSNLVTASHVRQEYSETTKRRLINFESYQNLILKRHAVEMAEEDSLRTSEEIQAIASSDLNDSNHIKWKKLLLVQGFLRKILRRKVALVEEKYSDMIRSYNSIKVKTTINSPQ